MEPVKLTPVKPRGRPKAVESGTTLSVWVPVTTYDQLCRLAQKREQTVSACAKSLLVLRLK